MLGIHAEHEPAPRANFEMRAALADPNAGLRWLVDAKLPAIAATGADPYIETSHLYAKGFIELFFALGLRPRFIILRRDARDVARSIFRLRNIPSRTKDGRMVWLDPSDAGTLPFPGWRQAEDYELCYWYALEMERRQAAYRERFVAEGIAFADVSLDELTTWDGFRRLCAFVAPERDPEPQRARFAELIATNQHPRDAILLGAADRTLPDDLDEREQRVRLAAFGADGPRATGSDVHRLHLSRQTDRSAAEFERLEYLVAKQAYQLEARDQRAAAELAELRERALLAETAVEAARAAEAEQRTSGAALQARLEATAGELAAAQLDNRRVGDALESQRAQARTREHDLQRRVERLTADLKTASARNAELVMLVDATRARFTLHDTLARELATSRRRTALHDARAAAAGGTSLDELDQTDRAAHRDDDRTIAALQHRCGVLERELGRLQLDVRSRDGVIEAMLGSRSWRVTAPLRSLRHLASRAAGRSGPARPGSEEFA